jgi:hypothetical protein
MLGRRAFNSVEKRLTRFVRGVLPQREWMTHDFVEDVLA